MSIVVNKYEISKSGNNILQYSEDFSNQIKKLASIIESINTAWEGQDSLAYINVMKEKYIVGLEELKEVISSYGFYLKNVPTTYSTLDETFASKNIFEGGD